MSMTDRNDSPLGSASMDEQVFEELVAVLAFSAEAAALIGGAPIPPGLSQFADEAAQSRGYESWIEAADVNAAETAYAEGSP